MRADRFQLIAIREAKQAKQEAVQVLAELALPTPLDTVARLNPALAADRQRLRELRHASKRLRRLLVDARQKTGEAALDRQTAEWRNIA